MKKNSLIILAAVGALAYFYFKGKGGGTASSTAPTAGKASATSPFTAPLTTSTATKPTAAANTIPTDIGNYAKSFSSLTSGLSGLYDNYFGGSSSSTPDTSGLGGYTASQDQSLSDLTAQY